MLTSIQLVSRYDDDSIRKMELGEGYIGTSGKRD